MYPALSIARTPQPRHSAPRVNVHQPLLANVNHLLYYIWYLLFYYYLSAYCHTVIDLYLDACDLPARREIYSRRLISISLMHTRVWRLKYGMYSLRWPQHIDACITTRHFWSRLHCRAKPIEFHATTAAAIQCERYEYSRAIIRYLLRAAAITAWCHNAGDYYTEILRHNKGPIFLLRRRLLPMTMISLLQILWHYTCRRRYRPCHSIYRLLHFEYFVYFITRRQWLKINDYSLPTPYHSPAATNLKFVLILIIY
jgi:hypothetical protein